MCQDVALRAARSRHNPACRSASRQGRVCKTSSRLFFMGCSASCLFMECIAGWATSVASRRSRQSCSPSTAASLTSCRRLRSRRRLCEFRHGSLCTCLRTLAIRASGGRALLSTESCYHYIGIRFFNLYYKSPETLWELRDWALSRCVGNTRHRAEFYTYGTRT